MRARTTMRGVLVGALAALIALAGASTAAAVVPGGMVTIAGVNGCIANTGAGGCSTGHDMGNTTGIAVSPDGNNVYVVGTNLSGVGGFSLLTFDRDPATGRLTQKPGTAGCFRSAGGASATCQLLTTGTALSTPSDIAITPDGTSLYVSNAGNDTVLAFNRAANGVLTQKTGALCVKNGAANATCAGADALDGPQSLAIDPTGRFLYVASSVSNGVTALRIGAGGALSQLSGSGGLSGCVNQAGTPPCDDGRALSGATALALSPAGDRVYVTSSSGRSLAVIIRNPTSGLLAMSTAANGCWEDVSLDGCTNLSPDFTGATTVGKLSVGKGGQVYVPVRGADGFPSRVVTFNPSGEGLARRTSGGCVSNGALAGCATGRGLGGPSVTVATDDGEDVYVTGSVAPAGVVELNRAANGSLSPRGDNRGCIAPTAVTDCTQFAAMGTPVRMAISPDDHHVYVANSAGRISVFKRDSSGPVCGSSEVTVPAGFQGLLDIPCFDEDGDALGFNVVVQPTLGSIGTINAATRRLNYSAPQNTGGTTTFTIRAAYTTFATFEAFATITVNVIAPEPAPNPGLNLGVDNDGDGFFGLQDCNDNDPNIHPGAVEIRGNHIDENCDTIAEPFPTLTSGVVHNWDFKKNSTSFTLRVLTITQHLPKGLTVTLKCIGSKKCPFKSKKLKLPKAKRNTINLMPALPKRHRKFRAGQTLEVWISAPEFNTKVARIKLKRGKQPVIEALCAYRGENRAQKRCV